MAGKPKPKKCFLAPSVAQAFCHLNQYNFGMICVHQSSLFQKQIPFFLFLFFFGGGVPNIIHDNLSKSKIDKRKDNGPKWTSTDQSKGPMRGAAQKQNSVKKDKKLHK